MSLRLFYLLVMLLCVKNTTAQVSISTDSKKICYWDSENKEFGNCSSDLTNVSLFELNKDETVIKHTTESISSTYYVKSQRYDSETSNYIFEVTSDVGNKYTFYISTTKKTVKILHLDDDNTYVIVYNIKAFF